MPTVKGVLGHLRRKSLSAGTRFAKHNEHQDEPFGGEPSNHLRSNSVPEPPSIQEHTDIFSLPAELHTQIFLAVQYRDLCSFRAASTRARDFLNEGEVLRQWINQHSDRQQLELYPPGKYPTFRYLLEQKVRKQKATKLAAVMAEYIEREILRYTLRRLDVFPNRSRNEVFQTVKLQLQDKMAPLIVTLHQYLEKCAASLIRTTSSNGAAFRDVFHAEERAIIEGYDPEHVHLVHKFWMFLMWLSNQILQRPSYAGTVERTMRGWSMDPLNRFTFRLFLVFGNTDALLQLIIAATPKHRRKIIDTFLSRLDPQKNVQWQQHWLQTGVRGAQNVTKEQAELILSLRLSDTELWVGSAEAVLVKHEIVLRQAQPIAIGTPWQVMDFLCDLAGYDVLHLPPSMH